MERRLETTILDLERISNMQNLDPLNPIVIRISHPTNHTVTSIVCAQSEPFTLVLPLNVTWFDLNPLSLNYRKALRRVDKTIDVTNGRQHTWETIDRYDELFVSQYYDDYDTAQLTTQNPVPAASIDVMGVARLSSPAQVPSNPIVVAEGDPRLSDARPAIAHTHAETPTTQLKTASGIVTIGGSEAPTAGATLVATSSTTAVWRRLTTADIQQ
jgi:hypothetical protein